MNATPRTHISLDLPRWVPEAARAYLVHTETGAPIRALAREKGCHASTVLRQIRRCEQRRDDLLVDEALTVLGARLAHDPKTPVVEESAMSDEQEPLTEDRLKREATRILRRMAESGTLLAVAPEMEKAVVVRETESGTTQRMAVVERDLAQAMALKTWIEPKTINARIMRYVITREGREALRSFMAEDENRAVVGFAEAQTAFAGQHRSFGTRMVREEGESRRLRYNMNESPLTGLARRRDKDGSPFLTDDLVRAGERLREDFELAQMGPNVTQNWDRFLTAGVESGLNGSKTGGSAAAERRVAEALRDLGPGLGDVVLRCCCYLEGLETAEKRMGWSARSGKIVLRIALQRLKAHYENCAPADCMIG